MLVAGLVNSFDLVYIENTVRLGYDSARNIAATFAPRSSRRPRRA
ncbi:hypothetical protein AB0395_33780 [Streptosporangium sp. NPDC051023]